jgi:GH24 family phage-related lysozyme (muramidase)
MNEHLSFGANGRRLLAAFEGEPRLTARRCEGDRWELSYGVTFDLAGDPIREGDTCTHEEHWALFANAVQLFEQAVRGHVTVELTQDQFDALVVFCYNIGPDEFAECSALERVNKRLWRDAVEAMGWYLYATSSGPSDKEMGIAAYQSIIGHDGEGRAIWLSPPEFGSAPCDYQRAVRGLYRRRCAEGCLLLGYDWIDAVDDTQTQIGVTSTRLFQQGKNRYRDRVDHKTSFEDVVLPKARQRPLSGAPAPAPIERAAKEAAAPVQVKEQVAPAPVGTKPPSPNSKQANEVTYGVDPKAGAKPLEESARVDAAFVQKIGRAGIRGVALGWLGSGGSTIASFLEKEPLFMDLYLMVLLLGVTTVVAFGIKSFGDWKRKRAEAAATQLIY